MASPATVRSVQCHATLLPSVRPNTILSCSFCFAALPSLPCNLPAAVESGPQHAVQDCAPLLLSSLLRVLKAPKVCGGGWLGRWRRRAKCDRALEQSRCGGVLLLGAETQPVHALLTSTCCLLLHALARSFEAMHRATWSLHFVAMCHPRGDDPNHLIAF